MATAVRGDDLTWAAAIVDNTQEFFDAFDRNVERVGSAAESNFARVDRSVQQSGREIGFIAGVVAGVTTKLIEMGMQGVAAIKNFLGSAVQLTARVGTLGVALTQVGRNAGYSDKELADFEKGVKSMGITTRNARQSLLQMAQANLDLGKASDIARVAQNAAVIAGVNSSEAFSRIVVAVQRLSPIMLRTLGITINLQEEYKRHAAATNQLAKNLDFQTKQQITLNAVLRAGEGIAGAYEAAMGSVGKQVTSLPRYIEELQLAIGEAFQPAYSIQIGWMTDKLKELKAWFEENEEAVGRFTDFITAAATALFDVLDGVIDFFSKAPGMVEEAGSILAKAVAQVLDAASPEEIEQRRSKLGEYFAQAVTMLVSFVATGMKMVTEFIGLAADASKAFLQMMNLVEGDWGATVDKLNDRMDNFGATVTDAFYDSMETMGEFMGVMEGVDEVVEEVGDTADNTSSRMNALFESVAAANAAMKKMTDELIAEAAKRALAEARAAEIEAVRMSHRIEDLERKHQGRLSKIAEQLAAKRRSVDEGADERVLDLKKKRTEKFIDIETSFRRRLRDIAEEFDYQAEDAARKNDAIALLRLMRDKKRQISKAKQSREDDRADATKNFDQQERALSDSISKQRTQLDGWLAEQLDKAEQQRVADEENLVRSIARKEELEAVHKKHLAEDRDRAMREELMALTSQFAQMDGMTQDALDRMLLKWEQYYGDLSFMSDEYAKVLAESAARVATEAAAKRWERGGSYGEMRGRGGVVGQAGQMSQMLAAMPRQINVPQMVSRVPAVAPVTSRSVREIKLSGDVSGLDPYFQRVLVAGLLEVERNRG